MDCNQSMKIFLHDWNNFNQSLQENMVLNMALCVMPDLGGEHQQ